MKIILPKPIFYFERWRYSPLYGMYVSNCGHLKDKNKVPITPKVNQSGYLVVNLKYGSDFVHRIVAAVWLPTEDMYHLTVDHLDHNKRNNAAYNLEWVTKKENQSRAEKDFSYSNPDNEIKNVLKIEMYADANYTCKVKTFSTYLETAEYLKTLLLNDSQTTIEKILEKLNNIKKGERYYGRYWLIETA